MSNQFIDSNPVRALGQAQLYLDRELPGQALTQIDLGEDNLPNDSDSLHVTALRAGFLALRMEHMMQTADTHPVRQVQLAHSVAEQVDGPTRRLEALIGRTIAPETPGEAETPRDRSIQLALTRGYAMLEAIGARAYTLGALHQASPTSLISLGAFAVARDHHRRADRAFGVLGDSFGAAKNAVYACRSEMAAGKTMAALGWFGHAIVLAIKTVGDAERRPLARQLIVHATSQALRGPRAALQQIAAHP